MRAVILLTAAALALMAPTREELNAACYGSGGPTKDCTLMLAKAIIGNAKKCYDLHKEREEYTGCTSSFCFSECGEAEGCAELCDEKAEQAFAVFSHSTYTPPPADDGDDSFVQLRERSHFLRRELAPPKNIDHHKCRVLCQRFMFKMLGEQFSNIDHPNDCMTKCDEVYPA